MVDYEVELADLVYPVGSIYMSVNNTDPSLLFGGEWEQIKDKFLLACGNNHNNGATGGSETVTLTTNQIPSHSHTQNAHYHGSGTNRAFITQKDDYTSSVGESRASGGSSFYVPSINSNVNWYGTANTSSTTATNNNTGGGQSHSNMPPYLAVYIWKRTG